MNNNRLSRGMKIEWNGLEFEIEERLSNGQLRLLSKNNLERRSIAETELIDAVYSGELIILGQEDETKFLENKIEQNQIYDFTGLDDADPRKVKALKRLAYVKELLRDKNSKFNNTEVRNAIDKVSKEIDDKSPPSVRTVLRWKTAYIKSGGDIRALVEASRAKGNRKRKFSNDPISSEEVLRLIKQSIDVIYLTPQRNSVTAVYDHLIYCINEINETRLENDQLPLPDRSAVYRIIARLPEYEVDKARKGERYAHEKHKTRRKGPEVSRPLERVECDDTKADLMVVDRETNLPLGRPWLMLLIDVYTKMILGYFLSFYPPSHVTVMMAMKHAIRPKSYVKVRYPDIINTWDSYGNIEVLVVDNAKHWHGKGIEDACYQLGTDIQYAPVRIPWYKGSIERLFNTINKALLHKQPGTTFSNIFDKGDYDPKKNALIYLDLLEELLHKWIIDVYSQDHHQGINDIPARRWKNSITRFPPALPPAHSNLDIVFGKITYRTISGTVIHFKNLEYSDSVLSTIRFNQKGTKEVKIKYDPTDLGMIYVFDEFLTKFVPVPAVDQHYAKGLTEWQHDVISKFIRRTNQSRIDKKALAEAKEYIRQRVLQALGERPKKLKSAVRIAKWMAFEDPSEPRIIDKETKNTNQPTNLSNGERPKEARRLPAPEKFILPAESDSEPLDWSDDNSWESMTANFDEEEE